MNAALAVIGRFTGTTVHRIPVKFPQRIDNMDMSIWAKVKRPVQAMCSKPLSAHNP